MADIVVVGSVNMDIVSHVQRLPAPGETHTAHSMRVNPGGKGANQAIAAARSGASVIMVGALGDDDFGRQLAGVLAAEQLFVAALTYKSGSESGCAMITVDDAGQNTIVVAPGANGLLDEADLYTTEWSDCTAIVLQNEIPLSVSLCAAQRAKECGLTVFYNPSPVMLGEQTLRLLAQADYLFVNEHEASALTDYKVFTPQSAAQAARALGAMGAGAVVVTLGEQGAVLRTRNGEIYHAPAYCVDAVDTTGAGDTMIGSFAAAVTAGKSDVEALSWATAAAALCVTQSGAQSAIPTWHQVSSFLARFRCTPVQFL